MKIASAFGFGHPTLTLLFLLIRIFVTRNIVLNCCFHLIISFISSTSIAFHNKLFLLSRDIVVVFENMDAWLNMKLHALSNFIIDFPLS
jgi:hypothetical protein